MLYALDNIIVHEVVKCSKSRSATYRVATKGGDMTKAWVVREIL
jgi:hypothetical protein